MAQNLSQTSKQAGKAAEQSANNAIWSEGKIDAGMANYAKFLQKASDLKQQNNQKFLDLYKNASPEERKVFDEYFMLDLKGKVLENEAKNTLYLNPNTGAPEYAE